MTSVTHIYSTIDILPLYIIVIVIVIINQLIPPLHWFNITTNCSLIRKRYVVTTRTYIAHTLTLSKQGPKYSLHTFIANCLPAALTPSVSMARSVNNLQKRSSQRAQYLKSRMGKPQHYYPSPMAHVRTSERTLTS